MQIDMSLFRETFFQEALEHLANMEAALLKLEESPRDRDLLDGIFRCAHSLKGGSGTFGFTEIASFTHGLESLLDKMRDGIILATPELIDLLLKASDILGELVTAAKTGSTVPVATADVLERLRQIQGAADTSVPAPGVVSVASARQEKKTYKIVFAPGGDLLLQGMDPLLLLRELSQLGDLQEVSVDLSRLPKLSYLEPSVCYLAWTMHVATDRPTSAIDDVFLFVRDSCDLTIEEMTDQAVEMLVDTLVEAVRSPEQKPTPSSADSPTRKIDESSIRVSIDKVDKLVNLVEELVIGQSMLNQTISDFRPDSLPALREAVAAMDRNLRDLQERVMAVRMVPISSVTGRYPRLVRELAHSLNKEIVCDMVGQDTELDKQVIERIGDPLTHLIRNSADHGIETPEERVAAGKSPEGTIRLAAFHQGDNVVIEVSDDGRGLNTERIRQKGLALGLLRPDEQASDSEVQSLIFAAGFSTAATVTSVSGRGVGMDVVKRSVEALNGNITLTSQAGQGTRIRIKLPLSLAILDGLCLGLGDETYVLPLLAVVETLQPRPGQVNTLFGRGEVLVMRGETLPMLRLGQILGAASRVTDPCQGLVVIAESEGRKFGLLVDNVLGQSQVVIKNLEKNYRKVECIAGATILGDGQVALILDVHGLARSTSVQRPPVAKELPQLDAILV